MDVATVQGATLGAAAVVSAVAGAAGIAEQAPGGLTKALAGFLKRES
jgi:xanthine/uracil/vitamin C permease (AzgA family)